MLNNIKYKNLLRWIRETHFIINSNEISLPEFEHNNSIIKIFFNRISKTGFHNIDKVQLLQNNNSRIINEEEVNNLLANEAKYRTRLYQEEIFSNNNLPSDNKGLLCLENCSITENILIDKYLLDISLSAKDQKQEDELLFNLKEKLKKSDNDLHQLWVNNNFIPGVSKFFHILDGIGNLNMEPFNHLPKSIGGEAKGRIWLNNPLNPTIDKSVIPSLDFFDLPVLDNDWTMKDATLDDLQIIHRWMNEPILAKSFRQNYSLKLWELELNHLINSPFTRPVILSYKNISSAYLEFFRPAGISIGNAFPFHPTEMGFHLGIVDLDLINKKLGRELIRDITFKILLNYPKKMMGGMIGEPDINNLSIVNSLVALSKLGLTYIVSSVAFPHKCSHIFRCLRNR